MFLDKVSVCSPGYPGACGNLLASCSELTHCCWSRHLVLTHWDVSLLSHWYKCSAGFCHFLANKWQKYVCKFKSEKNWYFDRQLYITTFTELRAVGVSSFKNLSALRSHLWERGVLEDRMSQDYPWLEGDCSSIPSGRQSTQQISQKQRSQLLKLDAFHVFFRYTWAPRWFCAGAIPQKQTSTAWEPHSSTCRQAPRPGWSDTLDRPIPPTCT